jgi:hypothetical protein
MTKFKAKPISIRQCLTFVILPSYFVLLAGCNVAPKYLGPKADLPTEFKTQGPWRTAKPSDAEARGD